MMLETLLVGIIIAAIGGYFVFNYALDLKGNAEAAALLSLEYAGIFVLLYLTTSIAMWLIQSAAIRSNVRRLALRRQAVELCHPDCRATLLSNGEWLLTSRATGKTVAIVAE